MLTVEPYHIAFVVPWILFWILVKYTFSHGILVTQLLSYSYIWI
jgi:hypothetical protein